MSALGSIKRQWKLWTAAVVAGVLLVVVGGPFVYFRLIEGAAPAPLSLSTTPSTTARTGASTAASAAPGSVDGTWSVGTGSVAGYRIKESLFGQSNTAVGRTRVVSGSLVLTGTTVASGRFSVDMTTVASDQSRRDDQFRHRIMDTSTYPTGTFILTQPIRLGTIPADGVPVTETATGDLKMHGVTKSVTFQVTASRSAATIQVSGSIPIVFADWNISNPSGGPATTEDHGILEFHLFFGR